MEGAIYSLTFRLEDSIPAPVLHRIHEQRKQRERTAVTALDRIEIRRRWEAEIDEQLDQGRGACHLKHPEVAQCVVDALKYFDNDLYDLLAWCVMPNHVHVVPAMRGQQSLARIFHSWKSYTSKRANKILGLSGTFWQREYYDRIVRDSEDLETTMRYVQMNPQKAGLVNWPWVWGAGGTPA